MSEISELYTIRDFIRWAVSQFNEAKLYYGHGTESAWDEACALILHTINLPHDINPMVLDARLVQSERKALLEVIEKRVQKRIPVPYITHEAWFAGLPYYVDERVLIPRSPIAELIENQFQPWAHEPTENILDLCTGSGCIAIASAKAFPNAMVDAADISLDAIEVAKMNISRHACEDQVHVYQADLFNGLPSKKYDLIVSNPPYVDATDMESLPPEYKHEPKLALQAGPDGLDVVIRILRDAKNYLKPHGILVVEVGNSEIALSEKFADVAFTWLEFERGGGGVFLLTYEQLVAAELIIEKTKLS
jgi:ribosomal protein L3 glutamine methyltransferase